MSSRRGRSKEAEFRETRAGASAAKGGVAILFIGIFFRNVSKSEGHRMSE